MATLAPGPAFAFARQLDHARRISVEAAEVNVHKRDKDGNVRAKDVLQPCAIGPIEPRAHGRVLESCCSFWGTPLPTSMIAEGRLPLGCLQLTKVQTLNFGQAAISG